MFLVVFFDQMGMCMAFYVDGLSDILQICFYAICVSLNSWEKKGFAHNAHLPEILISRSQVRISQPIRVGIVVSSFCRRLRGRLLSRVCPGIIRMAGATTRCPRVLKSPLRAKRKSGGNNSNLMIPL
jgi:hypothetical protein